MNKSLFASKDLIQIIHDAAMDCRTGLDLGSGEKSLLEGTGVNLVAVDIHPEYVRGRWNYITADILTTSFSKKCFDLVIMVNAIEHLNKTEVCKAGLFEKLDSWAKKRIVIFTPNGFIYNPLSDSNPYQEHRSGWFARDFREAGYQVFGLSGFKPLRKERGDFRYRPICLTQFVSIYSEYLVYYRPEWAFGLLAIKELG